MRTKKTVRWERLDNAAKIFPSASDKDRTQVFRFSCELTEPVEKEVLQRAVDKTLEDFPLYRSVLKRGLFWYYLEESNLKPEVELENQPPCSPIYDRNQKNLLFRVLYYKNRIHLEVYHVLSDGTGALQFLRALISYYLAIRYDFTAVSTDYDASDAQKADDSFQKYYSSKKGKKKKSKNGYQLKGAKYPESRLQVIEGIMPVKSVIDKAHEYQATVTEFLAAVLLCAIHDEMSLRARKRPVVLGIPVNLRNYFASASARNFFNMVNIGYDFKDGACDLKSVAAYVKGAFNRELTSENLMKQMNSYSAIEHNFLARITPLAVKDIALRIVYNVSSNEATAVLSNIGKVTMPDKLTPYIKLFNVCVSTNRLQICMCSYRDKMAVTFTSPFVSSEIQKRFFRTLSTMGIDIEIIANRNE